LDVCVRAQGHARAQGGDRADESAAVSGGPCEIGHGNTPGCDRGYCGRILRLAKSPPELFPTQSPTNPLVRSLNRVTTRLASVASLTKTRTCDPATTTRTWNQPFGSGTGFTGCSYTPGCPAPNFCPGEAGGET